MSVDARQGVYTDAEAQVLAKRAYPKGSSGMCSRHMPPYADVDCVIRFPDVWALVQAHCDLKQKAWKRLRELGEEPPKGDR